MNQCEKCKEKFTQNEISHDIPKYLGGFDCDGRHLLCKQCHDKYERTILARCFIKLFNQLIPYFEKREYTKYMGVLKNSPITRKAHFIAWEVKNEWWGNDNRN